MGQISDIQKIAKTEEFTNKNEWELIQQALVLAKKQLIEAQKNIENKNIQSTTLIEAIRDPMVIIDQFQNCLIMNQSFKTTFVKDKKTRLLGEAKLWKIFEEKDIQNLFASSVQQDFPLKIDSYFFPTLNKYFQISSTPIKNESNKIIGALGFFYDISDLKLSQQMRVDFVANVSHEIRTPLTSIKGFSQLLLTQKDQIPADLIQAVEKIVQNSEKITELYNDLLNLSLIESKDSLNKESVSLKHLIQNTQSLLHGKYAPKTLTLKTQFEDMQLNVDINLFEQVLLNLFENAMKYSPKNDIEISITAVATDNFKLITIVDNGPGIPASELNRIFERFYRVQGQTQNTIEGTGLGLSIVKHIIQKHDGTIHASNHEKGGAAFQIKLP